MNPKRRKIDVNAWAVFTRAIEEGVALGWRRAHKHTSNPSDVLILDTIETAVLESVCEVIDFGGGS